ncbi:MAG: alpha-ribazole phosphatase [Bacillota bacterium]
MVRHGETMWNKTLKYQGQTDIPLNEDGQNQARLTAEYFLDKDIDVIFSSDLKRAFRTAEIISEVRDSKNGATSLKISRYKDLREMNFGAWQGLTYQEIEENYPDLLKKWRNDPTSVEPENGENIVDFQKRVVDQLEDLIFKTERSNIVTVLHGGVIRVYLAYLLEMPLNNYWRLAIDNCGISIIDFYDGEPVIKLVNYTDHLD